MMTNLQQLLNLNRSSAIVAIVAMVLPLVGSVSSVYLITQYSEVTSWIRDNRELFFLITAFTMAVLMTPTTFIASLSGYLFGLLAVVYVVPAYGLASVFGFFVGSKLDGGQLLRSIVQIDDKQVLRRTVNSSPYWFVILCRISPVLPFGLMNVVLPAFGVKLDKFITAGTLGMLPRTFLFVWLGSTAQTMMQAIQGNDQPQYKFYLTSILVLMSSFGLIFLFKRKMKEINNSLEK